jgi:hypothetical protein
MIEVTLSLTEARWAMARTGIEQPSPDSPLADPLALVEAAPEGSPAEQAVIRGLESRGLALSGGSVNPFLAAALEALAVPEKVWCLSLFGPAGAEMVHLAFKDGDAVECRRSSKGFALRFPLRAAEAKNWLDTRIQGARHGR